MEGTHNENVNVHLLWRFSRPVLFYEEGDEVPGENSEQQLLYGITCKEKGNRKNQTEHDTHNRQFSFYDAEEQGCERGGAGCVDDHASAQSYLAAGYAFRGTCEKDAVFRKQRYVFIVGD